MTAAKTGYVAEFQTGYLQREIHTIATVAGGTDAGLRNASQTGYAVGRLVKVTGVGEGTDTNPLVIAAPTGVSATSIGDATHIIAQSDDTIRDVPEDFNYTERYTTLPNLIVKNSQSGKTVALYKIVNRDDIKIIDLGGNA